MVSIVSTIDFLFAKIFEFYFTNNPDKLSIENKTISFDELKKIHKIEDAQKFLINREVDLLLLQKGVRERLNIIKDDLGIIIPDNGGCIKELKKLVKMRNLIVHNESRIDAEFISLYGDGKVKIDETLKVDQKYLKDSVELVYFVGSFILQSAQTKFSKKPIHRNDYIINDAMHYLVEIERYDLLRPIYDFALIEGNLNDVNKRMIIINYCIALKKQGKPLEHIEKVLEVEDWTSTSDDFEMALNALRGNDKGFYELLNKSIQSKAIGLYELQTWEIFGFYRKKSQFKNLLEKARR